MITESTFFSASDFLELKACILQYTVDMLCNELHFALLGTLEHEGAVYKALIPVNEDGEEESEEYVILKCGVDEDGEDILETIEDDEEFDRIADIFDDEFSDIFYDDVD